MGVEINFRALNEYANQFSKEKCAPYEVPKII